MRIIIAFLTVSLVVCLTLCSNENRQEDDQDEFLEEVLDREKRDAIPQPRGNILFIYLFICLFISLSRKFFNLFGNSHSLRILTEFLQHLHANKTT